MLKKFLLSFFVVFTFAVYAYFVNHKDSDKITQVALNPAASPASSVVSVNPPDSEDQDKPINVTAPASQAPLVTSAQKYKDGSYTGNVVDAYYGNIQVKAIITGGKIADVQFLQYPNDRRTSVEINEQAIPFLKREAIQAQSAKVDIVSGATQSSEAFRISLQSALDKAV